MILIAGGFPPQDDLK